MVEPGVIDGIVLHEDVNEADADGNIAYHDGVVFKMALALDTVVHTLEFLLLQCYEVGIITVLIVGQQSFIGMYGAFSLHLQNLLATKLRNLWQINDNAIMFWLKNTKYWSF